MSAGELALAFVLITAPPGPAEADPAADRWTDVQAAVQKLATDLELLDKNEYRFLIARSDEFGKDLNILRKRYQDLKDAPPLADADRFPDRSAVNDLIRFNRSYRKSLEQRQQFESDKAEEIAAAIKETDRLYRIWDLVRDAKCDYYYTTVRRSALKQLKEQLGDDYATATLPPNVPTWRFADSR